MAYSAPLHSPFWGKSIHHHIEVPLVAGSVKQKQNHLGSAECFKSKAQDGFVSAFYVKVCTHINTHTHVSTSFRDLRCDVFYHQSTKCTQISYICYGTISIPVTAVSLYQPLRIVRFSFCWNTSKCEAIEEEKNIYAGKERNYAYKKLVILQ